MNKVMLRSEAGRDKLNALEAAWLSEDTNLSFNDWLYLYHNIFSYNVNNPTQLANAMNTYRKQSFSDPNKTPYIHFVKWGFVNGSYKFVDNVSGRTSAEIHDKYTELFGEGSPTKPSPEKPKKEGSKVKFDEYAEVEGDENFEDRDTVVDYYEAPSKLAAQAHNEWEQSGETSYTEFLYVHYNIVTTNTGKKFAKEYNESTYCIWGGPTYLSFASWMDQIKKQTRTSGLSYHELAERQRRIRNGEPPLLPNDVDVTVPKEQPHPTMTLADLEAHIARLEKMLQGEYTSGGESKLRMALNYRQKLLDKSNGVVYTVATVGENSQRGDNEPEETS